MDHNRGWLANPERKKRQERSLAFQDKDVQDLLDRISDMPNYISPTLGPEIDLLLRLRDKALISTGWIWFKRASEILGVQRKDVLLSETHIHMTFHIRKKAKRYKMCPVCNTRSGYRANFCRECQTDLEDVEIFGGSEEFIRTKRKTLKNEFTKPIVEWLEVFDKEINELGVEDREEAWFFPSLQVSFDTGYLKFFSEKSMTVQNLDAILQKLDPTLTSCFFRYFATEKYQVLGYSNEALKKIGDWSSTHMPEVYAKRKGLSVAERTFSEDIR